MGILFVLTLPLLPLFVNVWNRSLTALWLVAAVLVLRVVFRDAPKWTRGILWALLAVRLVLPVNIPSPFSAYNVSAFSADEYGSVEYEESLEPILDGTDFWSLWRDELQDAWEQSDGNDPFNPPPLQGYWLFGTGVMLFCALVSWLRLRHRVAASVSVEDGVLVCDEVGGPFILGVFRPKIYLPSKLASPQREYVLAHERAHLTRRDHWWKPLGYLLLAVCWFNPALWLCYILFCRDIELACDERAVQDLEQAGRAEYAQALLDCSRKRTGAQVCPLAFGEVGVKKRVKTVLRRKKPEAWLRIAALCACGAAAVCFLTGPQEVTAREDGSVPASKWLRDDEDVLAFVMGNYKINGQRIVSGEYDCAHISYLSEPYATGYKDFLVRTEDGKEYKVRAKGPFAPVRGPMPMRVTEVEWWLANPVCEYRF